MNKKIVAKALIDIGKLATLMSGSSVDARNNGMPEASALLDQYSNIATQIAETLTEQLIQE